MAEAMSDVDGQSTVMGISLLILILAAVPTLVTQSFGPTTFGLFLTGVVTAVIFGALNNQGYGWNALGTVQILTLLLFLVALPLTLSQATQLGILTGATLSMANTLFVLLTFLFAVYAVYGLFTESRGLPHLTFLFIAVMVGAGALIGITGTVLVTLAALLTIFAWPVVREKAPTQV